MRTNKDSRGGGHLLEGLVIAFSMYSRIPMPRAEWSPGGMAYALCWFPAVGVAVGAMMTAFTWLAGKFSLGNLAYCCLGAAIPLAVTGGIHMDGFLDTVDALSSFRERERKLEILKDPHTGAFAVIGMGVYLLLYLAAFDELGIRAFPGAAGIYVMTRALSGWSVVSFPKARRDGLATTFAAGAKDRAVKVISAVWWLAAGLWFVCFLGPAAAALLTAAGLFLYYLYYRMAMDQFGGMTGDLAGFFLQTAELVMIAVLAGLC